MARYRNPNGYGSVVHLSGRRRKPYVVRKTVGYDDRAYPIYEVVGYYEKREDALLALAEYNRDPYDINLSKSTFNEIYEMWSKDVYPKLNPSMKKNYQSAYKHCSQIYDAPYRSLRKSHMQACIDDCGRGFSTRSCIKMLLMQLDRFAFDHDVISKQYSTFLVTGVKEESTKHKIFTDDEVLALWKMRDKKFVDETLFMLYTGCRVSEMLQVECSNVNLDKNYFTGGVKTKNGKNRVIPIHPDIRNIVAEHLSDSKYLFDLNPKQGGAYFASNYCTKWAAAMKEYGFDHFTHDCRHTVRSKLDSAGANKVAIDRIMGHSSQSIGEKVYTHKSLEELQENIEKLVYVSTAS